MTLDPVRLVHSATDLHRAHIIAARLCPAHDVSGDQARVLELAFLADYSRPFIGLADESAPLMLERLDAELTVSEIWMHVALMALAADRASERRAGAIWPAADSVLLAGYAIDAVQELVRKLRRAVTAKLYQGIEPMSDEMRMMIGPIDGRQDANFASRVDPQANNAGSKIRQGAEKSRAAEMSRTADPQIGSRRVP